MNQLQVVTSGGQAEFGRALGGYVNVVTRSGTNDLHGDVYGFFRNSSFNAANALSHAVLPLTQSQYGASMGGPIVHDRTFYFTNFEQRMLNQSGLVTISPANASLINGDLAKVGYPGLRVATGLYSNPVHMTDFFRKSIIGSATPTSSASGIASTTSIAEIHAAPVDSVRRALRPIFMTRITSSR